MGSSGLYSVMFCDITHGIPCTMWNAVQGLFCDITHGILRTVFHKSLHAQRIVRSTWDKCWQYWTWMWYWGNLISSWWNRELGNVVVRGKGENEICFESERDCGAWGGRGEAKVCECCVERSKWKWERLGGGFLSSKSSALTFYGEGLACETSIN